MYYLVSIGSNIAPQKNLARTLELLLQRYERFFLYPICFTQSVAMPQESVFLNTLVILKCALSAGDLKRQLEQIEETLGRDRSAPDRSISDRTCDLDILDAETVPQQLRVDLTNEPYLKTVLAATVSDVQLSLFGCRLPKTATTVYFEGTTGHEVVFEQGLDALVQRPKAIVGG